MAYTFNGDFWSWINPETQKPLVLRRGDEVPQEVLDQEGVNVEEMSKGYAPMFLKSDEPKARELKESDSENTNESARTLGEQNSGSPKQSQDKK